MAGWLATVGGVALITTLDKPYVSCPVFEVTRTTEEVEVCSSAGGSRGALWTTFTGTLIGRSGETLFPIEHGRFLRECLNELGDVVVSVPLEISLDDNGEFSHSIFIKSVSERYCDGSKRVFTEHMERVRVRVQAHGCDDFVVEYDQSWDSRELELVCSRRTHGGPLSNNDLNLTVRPVTVHACARPAPGRPAG